MVGESVFHTEIGYRWRICPKRRVFVLQIPTVDFIEVVAETFVVCQLVETLFFHYIECYLRIVAILAPYRRVYRLKQFTNIVIPRPINILCQIVKRLQIRRQFGFYRHLAPYRLIGIVYLDFHTVL